MFKRTPVLIPVVAAADEGVYVATEDGTVTCMK